MISVFEKELLKQPNELSLLSNIAYCYMQISEYDEALTHIAHAEELFMTGVATDLVKMAKTFERKGSILLRKKCYGKSIEAFEHSFAFKENSKVKYLLTKAELLKNELDQSSEKVRGSLFSRSRMTMNARTRRRSMNTCTRKRFGLSFLVQTMRITLCLK